MAIDCEMVGMGPRQVSGLARCSIVNLYGTVLYDKFIRPEGDITNYRTQVSGVTPLHMAGATPFAEAKSEVSKDPPASPVPPLESAVRPPYKIAQHHPGLLCWAEEELRQGTKGSKSDSEVFLEGSHFLQTLE